MSTQNKRIGFSRRLGVVVAAALVVLCLLAAAFAFSSQPTASSEGSASGIAAGSAATTADTTSGQTVQLSGETYEKNTELTVRFLDVGQGDATLLESRGH